MNTLSIRANPRVVNLTLNIPPGDAGTDCTIAAMVAIAHDAAAHSANVREWAQQLATPSIREPVAPRVYAAMRQTVRFKSDPSKVELVTHPAVLTERIRRDGFAEGDCDDLATLAVALLLAMRADWEPCFIVCARGSGDYEHVFYGLAYRTVKGGVWPYDPQERTPAGEWPKQLRRVKVYSAINGRVVSIADAIPTTPPTAANA